MPNQRSGANPFALLGLTASQGRELNECLQQVLSADDEPYAAMDALLFISSLELTPQGDNSRVYLMGGGLLDGLADLICICDEEWISGVDGEDDKEVDEEETKEERDASLELCSRALNAFGSMATFAPFLQSVLEEDLCDAPLEDDLVQALAPHINRGIDTDSGAFQPRSFGPGLRVLHYPLLCAILFWARTERHAGCRAQAVFALSWLLTDPNVQALLVPAGLVEILFRLLEEQVGGTGRSTPGLSESASSERVSATAESLRLYTCIALQRISRSPFPLFADQPADVAASRLSLLLRLLATVHSFNIRAILLHVLLRAVTPATPTATATAASGLPAGRTDLQLPLLPATVAALTQFRANCGSIGSSNSSRRTSPALDARPVPTRIVPPLSVGPAAPSSTPASSTVASAAPAPAPAAVRSGSFSYAAAAAAAASSTRTPAVAAAPASRSPLSADVGARPTAPAGGEDGGDEDGDDVGELLRDPEAGVDKTAQLEQLVDAILQASGAAPADVSTVNPSA